MPTCVSAKDAVLAIRNLANEDATVAELSEYIVLIKNLIKEDSRFMSNEEIASCKKLILDMQNRRKDIKFRDKLDILCTMWSKNISKSIGVVHAEPV